MSSLERLMGGSPLGVLLKLVFLSLLVGVVLAAIGLSPVELAREALDAGRALIEAGFRSLHDFGRYIVTGAVIVVPLWLLSRLASARRSG